MNDDKQSRESGQGQGQFYFLLAGAVKMPAQTMTPSSGASVEELVAAQITKRIQIPIAVTTAILCAILSVSAVIVGIIVLAVPFTIGCVFSVYAVYSLREGVMEERMVMSFEPTESDSQAGLPLFNSKAMSENSNDAQPENTAEEK